MNKPLQPGSEEHAGGPPTKWPARIGLSRHSAAGFLVTLILLFIINPFIEFMRNGVLVESVVVTLVLVWGVLAVGKRRRTLVLGILFAIPPIMGKWANHFRPDLVSNEVFLISGLFYILFVIVHSLAFILRAPNVNSEVLCAGLSTYLLLGLLWCFAYRLASVIDSHAISIITGPGSTQMLTGSEALYFSLITLTTVGYGDIVPTSSVVRMMAAMEAMTGTLFVAVLISRLVAMYSSRPPSEPGDRRTG